MYRAFGVPHHGLSLSFIQAQAQNLGGVAWMFVAAVLTARDYKEFFPDSKGFAVMVALCIAIVALSIGVASCIQFVGALNVKPAKTWIQKLGRRAAAVVVVLLMSHLISVCLVIAGRAIEM
ncbi:hypothetical protein ACIP1U_04095 [Cupriavidus sp. NPDC089707]|uniref:hypothetical protein n=1 Tax=Cupriavidus sp. NPDC089707 TaxID=3363963 RepID=UPI0038078EE2